MVSSFNFTPPLPYVSFIDPGFDPDVVTEVNALRDSNPFTAYAGLFFHATRTAIVCDFDGLRTNPTTFLLKDPTQSRRPLHGNILCTALKSVVAGDHPTSAKASAFIRGSSENPLHI